MNKKVAVIEPVGGHGGMDYYDFGLCEGLVSSGVNVVLHTCDETVKKSNQSFEVRHTFAGIYGNSPVWKRGIRFLIASVKAMFSSLLEGRSVIHFHFFHVGVLPLMEILLARFFFRKVVITAHDVESFSAALEVPFMSRLAYRLAHGIIAHNNFSRDELIRCLGVKEDKVSVIPSGNYLHVAERPLSPEEARKRLGISPKSKVLLFFGQIKTVKRLDLLLEAMPEILRLQPDTILLIAGRPWKTDFSTYQQQIDRLQIGDACTTHIRFITDEELPCYYEAADLVVMPYERIYQSAVVLMSMSYEKAVLVSDLPGMTAIVTDGETGFVFPQGNVVELAKRIVEILGSDLCRNKVAASGFRHMRDNYNWASIGTKTSELYQSLRG